MTLSPPVFDVLSALALRLGVRVSARELQAQSAQLGDGPLSLMSAAQALGRHGLEARIGQLSPEHYDARMGPVVVGLEREGAALLLDRQEQTCQVLVPGASPASDVRRTTHALQADWSGWSLQARLSTVRDGVHDMDDAQGDRPVQDAHWFWGVFRTLRTYYLDSTVAAVMINLLALATSMFSMNVYDRVIPNAALHSLWVLAIGVTLAGLLELGLRTLRGYLVDVAGKKADVLLSASLFRHILNLRAQDRPGSSGQFAGQLRDFESVRDFVSSTTLVAFSDVPFIFLFLLVIGLLGGPLVWVPVVGAVLVLAAGWLSQWPIRQ
jgi:ATP-binding cassette subfamily C protein LapB